MNELHRARCDRDEGKRARARILRQPIGFAAAALAFAFLGMAARAEDPWVVYEGFEGPGQGQHVVLISGDEEYRSEEALPQLGKILAKRHGFKATVLFAIDKKDGSINPDEQGNIPGLEALEDADLMVIATRFRNLPDEQMEHIVDYVESGRPILGLRTATHAFSIPKDREYARYSFNSKDWDGGFGRQVLGETWINHHGAHGKQSTGGMLAEGAKDHPILRGIRDRDIWGPTDVYGVRLPLPEHSTPLVLGAVLEGMSPDDKPVEGKQNDPMMPVAWVRALPVEGEGEGDGEKKTQRLFCSTLGAATDLVSEGTRRLLVNAVYWLVGLEDKIPAKSDVTLVGEFKPSAFKFGGARKGVYPRDHALDAKTDAK